ncbi:penicillin-binding protein 2 [candidate division WOR-3 bacterium]|nr:penicillin-binding protein 2 [candidate division WOR-3 bacterium]
MHTRRLFFTIFCLLAIEVLLLGRIVWLQTAKWGEYKKMVDDQATCNITFRPKRGRIYDCNFELLATSIKTKSLYTIPAILENPRVTAKILEEKGFGSYQGYRARFEKYPKFIWIKRHINTEGDEKIEGVYISDDVKRVYPLKLGTSVIGKTDPYGVGLAGIEYKFNKMLEGEPCTITMGKTPAGRLYPHPLYVLKEPKRGCDIILTIDATIQSTIEEELKKGVEKFKAKGGMAIVVNPKTGEILAMTSIGKNGNSTVEAQFEPGSTFKIVTLASVLEDSLVSFDTIVEDGTGSCVVGRKVIKDERKHGPFTLRQAVARSSNVAFVNLANMVGNKKLYEMAIMFGFSQKTGIGLPCEVLGNIYPSSEWTPLRLANVAFGQGVSCTFLQLSMAYASIANWGLLLKPYIVKEIIDGNGKVLYTTETEVVRRVIDESTSRDMIDLLMGVVSDTGTGVLAQVRGLNIAGKTGTAQKFKNGKYTEDYISSFIGFFPANDPSFLVGVLIDEPEDIHFGSLVAAPLFKNIVTRIISSEMIARY